MIRTIASRWWLLALLLGLTTACEQEKDIYGIFYADIVTCHRGNDGTYFTHQATDSAPLDTLYPVGAVNEAKTAEGVRVLLQYRPVETLGENRQRIEIQALWKTGDFLNLRYRIDYHSRPHTLMLVADESTLAGDTLKMELRHSRNDDPEGHWTNLYSSFNIEGYRSRPYTTLQLYVNQVNFNYKYYYFKLH